MKLNKRHKNRGMGMLALLVGCLLVVLTTFGLNQRFSSNLTRQREMVSSGRRAFALAESAISEALLSFKRGMNEPSDDKDSWFQLIRQPINDDYGCIEKKSFNPIATRSMSNDGVRVDEVKMSLWLQKPINKAQRDKQALLTLTAVVRVPRRCGFLGTHIVRNLQKSYEFKLAHLSAPSPLNGFTLFIGSYGYLRGCREGYEKYQKSYEQREKQQEGNTDTDMEYWRDYVSRRQRAAQKELDKVRPYLSNPTFRRTFDAALKTKGMSLALLENMEKTNPDEWMKSAGYHTDFQDVDWPVFRSASDSLSNNAYVNQNKIVGSELTLSLPQFPSFPTPHPSSAIPADPNTWDWPTMTALSTPFANWIEAYDSSIGPYEQVINKELRRHEKLIKLVKDKDLDTFSNVLLPRTLPLHWKHKASYVFENQDQLLKCLMGKDGLLHIDGVCFVDGSLALDTFSYVGKGTIVATGDVTLDGAIGRPGSLLTVVSGKEIFLNGFIRAALLAPKGTVHFRGNFVNGTVLEWQHSDNDFTIKYDKRHRAKLANHHCTLSPYSVACSLVRK